MFGQELIDQLVQRELQKNKMAQTYAIKPEEQQAPVAPTTLSPKLAMLLGNLGDAASTYGALKSGNGQESNKTFGYFNKHPWTVLPTAAATTLGMTMLHKALSRMSPKVADTVAGLQGGFQAAAAGNNLESTLDPTKGESGTANIAQDFRTALNMRNK